MTNIQSILTTIFIIAACLGSFTVFTVVLFYTLTMYTQIPVDNNYIFVGSCILMGCLGVMLSVFALVGKDGKKKHD